MGKDKDREKHNKKPQWHCISHMEMLHVMLKYPEIVTNLDFIKVSIMTLKLRAGTAINSDAEREDGAFVIAAIEDKVTPVGIWRPELLHICNKLGDYY
eukprot:9082097-Ditylum_brightwellii.AAC.1